MMDSVKSVVNNSPPLATIRAFFAQKARVCASLSDHGSAFECRFLSRLLNKIADKLTLATAEARTIERGLVEIRQQILRETSATDDTPGVLDPIESQDILQRLKKLGTQSTGHVQTLEQIG